MTLVSDMSKQLTVGRYVYLGTPDRIEYRVLRVFRSRNNIDGKHWTGRVTRWIVLCQASGEETTRAIQDVAKQIVQEGEIE